MVDGVVLKENLITLEMHDFDVILGMNWLSTHCESVISTLEAKRLLHERCKAYLAYMIDKSSSKVTMDSVQVVREFLDVFPEDLLGLPPDQELKLEIELLSGLASIFIPPYGMVPTELKELKTQL